MSINFEDTMDSCLARIMLLEFKDSMRRVKNSVIMSFSDKEPPEELKAAFPNAYKTKYSNGFLIMKFTAANHFKEG